MLGHAAIGQVALGQAPSLTTAAAVDGHTGSAGQPSQHVAIAAHRDHLQRLVADDDAVVLLLALTL